MNEVYTVCDNRPYECRLYWAGDDLKKALEYADRVVNDPDDCFCDCVIVHSWKDGNPEEVEVVIRKEE